MAPRSDVSGRFNSSADGGQGGHHPRPETKREETEREIVTAAAAHDAGASTKLVDEFTPHVRGVARIYRGVAGIHRAELMQAGIEGLLRAASRYDARIGAPFWAYASWWVRQAMQHHVAEMTRPMVLSDRALRQLARVRDARRSYMQSHRHEPSVPDLAEETALTRPQVESLLATERRPRSLDEPIWDEAPVDETFENLVEDPRAEDEYDRVLEGVATDGLPELTETLEGRERTIVFSHFGLGCAPKTLREIGAGLGLSVERVRQLEERALGKLRDAALADPRGLGRRRVTGVRRYAAAGLADAAGPDAPPRRQHPRPPRRRSARPASPESRRSRGGRRSAHGR